MTTTTAPVTQTLADALLDAHALNWSAKRIECMNAMSDHGVKPSLIDMLATIDPDESGDAHQFRAALRLVLTIMVVESDAAEIG